jgi:hypothetical protein
VSRDRRGCNAIADAQPREHLAFFSLPRLEPLADRRDRQRTQVAIASMPLTIGLRAPERRDPVAARSGGEILRSPQSAREVLVRRGRRYRSRENNRPRHSPGCRA